MKKEKKEKKLCVLSRYQIHVVSVSVSDSEAVTPSLLYTHAFMEQKLKMTAFTGDTSRLYHTVKEWRSGDCIFILLEMARN